MAEQAEDVAAAIERISDYTPFLSNRDIIKLTFLAIEGNDGMRSCTDLAARIAGLKAERDRISDQIADLAIDLAEALARLLPSSAGQVIGVAADAG